MMAKEGSRIGSPLNATKEAVASTDSPQKIADIASIPLPIDNTKQSELDDNIEAAAAPKDTEEASKSSPAANSKGKEDDEFNIAGKMDIRMRQRLKITFY